MRDDTNLVWPGDSDSNFEVDHFLQCLLDLVLVADGYLPLSMLDGGVLGSVHMV